MKKYFVALEVIYPIIVEADNEEEAVDKALDECPYDVDGEPAVSLYEEWVVE